MIKAVSLKENKDNASPLSSYCDFFNVNRTRNSENTDIDDYNCGGYCLNTYSWYNPFEDFLDKSGFWDFYDWAYELRENEKLEKEEMFDIMSKIAIEQILTDFPDTVRLINEATEITKEEKIVIFKIGIEFGDEEIDEPLITHADFHFKEWCNGICYDKPGSSSIRTTKIKLQDCIYDNWETPWWGEESEGYCSNPVLFAVKEG